MKVLIVLKKFLSSLLDLSGIIAGFIIAIVGVMVSWGVIARYFFIPSYWVEPYSIYLFIGASFLGAAYAMKKGEHVKVDILIRVLSPVVRKGVDLLTASLAFVFFIYLTWRSTLMVKHSYQSKTTDLSLLEIYVWIPQSFVVLGSILMCLSIIWYVLNIITPDDKQQSPLV
ncbi:TRAP transporter small permease [Aquibacillus sediminis]|uniref:TRAP transporter small permease n=1 Tax=Aquibacillus sediminis TaxID=2574734 RepID=UPI001109589B|nr:TRAP transporter small permease [Aquibacillus sediminis]